jgi:hypothetical protein
MSHTFTLALVYALVLQAACLLHAAAAAWAATRRVTLEPLTLIAAAVAAAVGMALATNVVTSALGLAPDRLAAAGSHPWLATLGWLGALVLLFLALLLHETSRLGRTWRAMGANAAGLVAVGVPIGLVLPTLLGLILAGFAGHQAPVSATTDWLPLACLALLVLGRPDRPKGRATLTALLAWLTGTLVAGVELALGPPVHVFVIAAATLLAARLVAPRLARHGID